MHGLPMQTGSPNGVRSSDWLDTVVDPKNAFIILQ